ncbi:MAG: aspartate aminotransferase family protein [Candidatus Eiseniibacteriota bacterium]
MNAPKNGATGAATKASSADIVRRHRERLFPNISNYYQQPIALERAKGMRVWDVEGREYLDFFGGILTISVGHCNDHVVGAIAEQAKTLGHTSTLYPNERIVSLAERLGDLTPVGADPKGRPPKVFLTNSGTEADETAVLTARLFTGHTEVVALRHGYSGRSALAMSLTGQAPWRHWGEGVPGIKHAVNAYCYRCPFGLTYPSCGVKCGKDLEDMIRTTTSGRIAGLIAEPIQGVGGFITPPKEFFEIVVGIARKYGGLFICDEVQSGFGRTGTYWNGIEHWGVKPEIMTFAKGIANGMPVGATVARADVADAFAGLTISTFGGNPVSDAAAHATIDELERIDAPRRAAEMGARFRAGLEALQRKYPRIGDVRGLGLMQGLELVKDPTSREPDPELTGKLFEATRERGLLIGKGGLYGNVIRLSPPLIVEAAEVDHALAVLDASFAAITA